jgi:hypothetical protein
LSERPFKGGKEKSCRHFLQYIDDANNSKISSILFTCPNEVDMALDLPWDSHWSGLRLWGNPL